MDTSFIDAKGTRLATSEMIGEILGFMNMSQDARYKVIIGSDSEARESDEVDFATAIVVHRVGNGGRYFWRRREFKRFHTLRDRIIQEVVLSIETAKEILLALETFNAPAFDFEIHVDIGENGATKAMMQEVLGMVRAYNFEARTKPESYAASKVADRHV